MMGTRDHHDDGSHPRSAPGSRMCSWNSLLASPKLKVDSVELRLRRALRGSGPGSNWLDGDRVCSDSDGGTASSSDVSVFRRLLNEVRGVVAFTPPGETCDGRLLSPRGLLWESGLLRDSMVMKGT